ncbi:hypothetical protein [Neptuniibacter halophilus]|uniref:hypothetical protein n=1 Tax=Neptuniibacter halophilus TaxID=651666 RepID=UPI0025744E72|nr:hypothetical protein [Neptuniibacter halophilus]
MILPEFSLQRSLRISSLFLLVLSLAGCVTSVHKGQHEHLQTSLASQENHQLLMTTADIQIFELGVSSAEEVPEWTQTGTELVTEAVTAEFSGLEKFRVVGQPELSGEEKQLLEQYAELYYPVVESEITRNRHPAWNQDALSTKTTLGPGLAFLNEKYGLNYIVFTSGQDYISTEGRKAAMVAAAIFGVAIPMGFSYLTVGIVETETGNVIWNNFVFSQEVGFLTEEDVQKSVIKALETLPAEAVGRTAVVQVAGK